MDPSEESVGAEEEVTALLHAFRGGNREALDLLTPLVYEELRGIAQRQLGGERSGHTLQATALVHEAFLRLVRIDRIQWQDRAHFFGLSARLMRQILIDYAHWRTALKRGGTDEALSLDEARAGSATDGAIDENDAERLIALDNALTQLAEMDERQCRVVECRFFAGMTVRETAEALEMSPATVKRDWSLARAWLNRELKGLDLS